MLSTVVSTSRRRIPVAAQARRGGASPLLFQPAARAHSFLGSLRFSTSPRARHQRRPARRSASSTLSASDGRSAASPVRSSASCSDHQENAPALVNSLPPMRTVIARPIRATPVRLQRSHLVRLERSHPGSGERSQASCGRRKWSEREDLNLRPPAPHRGFGSQQAGARDGPERPRSAQTARTWDRVAESHPTSRHLTEPRDLTTVSLTGQASQARPPTSLS